MLGNPRPARSVARRIDPHSRDREMPPRQGGSMSSRRIAVGISLIALGLALPAVALAQGRVVNDRHGLWGSVGLGAGSAAVSCTGCGSDRETGISGHGTLGGTLRPNLLLGGETNGWTKSSNNETDTFSYLTAVIVFYPAVTAGFFLKGGLGFGTTQFEGDVYGVPLKLESSGIAFQAGTGYDIPLKSSFSITVFGNFLTTAGAGAKFNGKSLDENLDGNLLQFGLAATWH
jgi:hypothetical protein